MLETFKHTVDYLSTPTISFSILTIVTPILFPPTDWFDKVNRKLGFYLLWTKTGLIAALSAISFFFVVGYLDENFNVILTKPDNFPIVLMVYSIFFFIWSGVTKLRTCLFERAFVTASSFFKIILMMSCALAFSI